MYVCMYVCIYNQEQSTHGVAITAPNLTYIYATAGFQPQCITQYTDREQLSVGFLQARTNHMSKGHTFILFRESGPGEFAPMSCRYNS